MWGHDLFYTLCAGDIFLFIIWCPATNLLSHCINPTLELLHHKLWLSDWGVSSKYMVICENVEFSIVAYVGHAYGSTILPI